MAITLRSDCVYVSLFAPATQVAPTSINDFVMTISPATLFALDLDYAWTYSSDVNGELIKNDIPTTNSTYETSGLIRPKMAEIQYDLTSISDHQKKLLLHYQTTRTPLIFFDGAAGEFEASESNRLGRKDKTYLNPYYLAIAGYIERYNGTTVSNAKMSGEHGMIVRILYVATASKVTNTVDGYVELKNWYKASE